MRYDLEQKLSNLEGGLIKDADTPQGYTLRIALIRSAYYIPKGKQPSVEQKLQAYALAKRLAQAQQFIDLTPVELAFLHEQAASLWSTLLLGQVHELLERPLPADPAEPLKGPAFDKAGHLVDQPAANIPKAN